MSAVHDRTLSTLWMSPTVEELDDVSEVHVVVHDDLAINRDQGQGQEEDKVLWGDPGSHPDHLPHRKHILVQELCTRKHTHRQNAFS